MKHYSFTIDITPMAAPRPRFSKFGVYNNQAYTDYKAVIKAAAIKAGITPAVGVISVNVRFYMPMAKSLSKRKRALLNTKHHTKKPDIDNLQKGLFDALNGVAFVDDAQIASVTALKYHSERPCIEVCIAACEASHA